MTTVTTHKQRYKYGANHAVATTTIMTFSSKTFIFVLFVAVSVAQAEEKQTESRSAEYPNEDSENGFKFPGKSSSSYTPHPSKPVQVIRPPISPPSEPPSYLVQTQRPLRIPNLHPIPPPNPKIPQKLIHPGYPQPPFPHFDQTHSQHGPLIFPQQPHPHRPLTPTYYPQKPQFPSKKPTEPNFPTFPPQKPHFPFPPHQGPTIEPQFPFPPQRPSIPPQFPSKPVNPHVPYPDEEYDLTHSIPGHPGKDYPTYAVIPRSEFQCDVNYPGFYADMHSGCQVWHYCQLDGRLDSFLCPNGTIFNQKYFVCDWWYNVDCESSVHFYPLNSNLYREPHHQRPYGSLTQVEDQDQVSYRKS